MGSRIGYCVRDKKHGRSDIFRKQWMSSIEEGIEKMWTLLGGKPGDGMQAIREDLMIGRGFAAMVVAFYNPPFDSIEKDIHCDIADNGLIEVDVSDYKKWIVNHIDIVWKEGDNEGKKTTIATMTANGFKWTVDEKTRERLGEGLC